MREIKTPCLKWAATVGFTIIFIISAISGKALAYQAPDGSTEQALILLRADAHIERVSRAIEDAGGHVTHVFPPSAFIATIPTNAALPAGIAAIHRDTVSQAAISQQGDTVSQALRVWNSLLASSTPPTRPSLDSLGEELVGDAMTAPAPQALQALAGNDSPLPDYTETSEFLIGRVAVGIVRPESNGGIDASTEDWSEDEHSLVLSEITSALDWWATLEPNAHLTFVYDESAIPTSYEPINHPQSDQSLWIGEVMERKGYTQTSYFDQVRHHNDELRKTYDTDWAFTIFVVDSSNDDDNRFTDEYFAYAYIGGPFAVMTYGNNGYGPQNMDAVAAHEIGHIFFALDQYQAAQQLCTRRSGYLGVENQNSEYGGCASDIPSIMRGHVWPYQNNTIDEYARGQVGWRDSDGDGILDPVDTQMSISDFEYVIEPQRSNVMTFTGSVRDMPASSSWRRNIIINTIERIEYRVASSLWQEAQPTDENFDTYTETFSFTPPQLPTGEWDVDVRVTDSAGNILTKTMTSISVVDPVDDILDTTLIRMGQQTIGESQSQITYSGRGESTASHIENIHYRIDEGDWQSATPDDGAFDEAKEDFTLHIDLTGLSSGEHQIQARSVDGEGNMETSPATDSIFVQKQVEYVFLPLVQTSR